MKEKNMPIGVKILAILAYIGAVADLLLGLGFIFGASTLGVLLAQFSPIFATLGAGLIAIGGIVLLLFAILNYFIGKGLWNGQNWSRVLVLIFMVIGGLGSLLGFLSGEFGAIVSLIIYGIIIWYLGFNQSVVRAFN